MSTVLSTRTAGPVRVGDRTPEGRAARRRALYHLAAPVAVLTVSHEGRVHGTTVSSVPFLSREPLLLGACLRADSEFADLAARAGRYTVNVLTAEQGDTARHFADSGRPPGLEQFADLAWTPDPYAHAPLLDDALAQYTCRFSGTSRIGDRSLLIGHVTHAAVGQGDPLISYAGGLFAGSLDPARDPGPVHRTRKETAA
ncbi:flavin reductase family protein [Streptomyces fragilis]|uniref:Flavin reductase family protein n=1 Tax=Streptomyces fragilis TaxID=67301 RepID=A0ABV2YIN7_9ACTN|nr:flavin reductase family protein [Streptomyces fragilis]